MVKTIIKAPEQGAYRFDSRSYIASFERLRGGVATEPSDGEMRVVTQEN